METSFGFLIFCILVVIVVHGITFHFAVKYMLSRDEDTKRKKAKETEETNDISVLDSLVNRIHLIEAKTGTKPKQIYISEQEFDLLVKEKSITFNEPFVEPSTVLLRIDDVIIKILNEDKLDTKVIPPSRN